MCSFLLTSMPVSLSHPCNGELSKRGPDHSSLVRIGDFTGIHNLLSITGEFTEQPLSKDGVFVFFNGEIYNYNKLGDYRSDGYAILEGYLQAGTEIFRHLEGEYAILILDTRSNEMIAATDTFGTKPFWFASNGKDFAFASLASAITQLGLPPPMELPPNSFTVFSGRSLKILKREIVTQFDLRQRGASLDDWCRVFDEAVKSRARLDRPDEKIFIGLSTGYDSGAIAASLLKTGRQFQAFSIYDKALLPKYFERTLAISRSADHDYIRDTRRQSPPRIECEPYPYSVFSLQGDYHEPHISVYNDSGAQGLWMICGKAQSLGFKVYLSGSGADEIISDYGFQGRRIFRHSNFGGYFKENLYSMFPWPSVFGSSMRSYLRKEEYIAGHFGIEGRYPFLDRKVVQTYLNLEPAVKNNVYKAPLDYYLKVNNFPCEKGVKHGF